MGSVNSCRSPYALAEQLAGGLGPAVLPRPALAQSDLVFHRRKQSLVVVRHVSDDRVVAVVEVVSPGNKSSRQALEEFVRKVAEFLSRRVHLLLLDLLPPGRFDPQGIHGAIWDYRGLIPIGVGGRPAAVEGRDRGSEPELSQPLKPAPRPHPPGPRSETGARSFPAPSCSGRRSA